MAAPYTDMKRSPSWSLFKEIPESMEVQLDLNPQIQQQMNKVKEILRADRIMNDSRLEGEVSWFYGPLGLSPQYFETYTAEEIARLISSLYAAKNLAHQNGSPLDIRVSEGKKGRALYVAHSSPGSRGGVCQQIEYHIEAEFMGEGYDRTNTEQRRWRVQCYRTKGTVAPDSTAQLRMYILSEPRYKNPTPSETETDLTQIADQQFLSSVPQDVQKEYAAIIAEAVKCSGPVIKLTQNEVPTGKHLLVAYRSGTTHSFFSGMTDLYHSYNHYSTRKFIEHFSNGITVFDFHLIPLKPENQLTPQLEAQMIEGANLVYILPRTSISHLFDKGVLSAKEHAYAYAGWKFAYHFLSRQSAEFAGLALTLKNDPTGAQLLSKIKSVVRKEAYSESRLMEAIANYPALVHDLYKDFEKRHWSLAQDVKSADAEIAALTTKIQRTVPNDIDRQVFNAFIAFNKSILKTNFFYSGKVALSFRLEPSFLSKDDYPVTPFAIFLVVGPEFRGFHVRFRDIARGGIRIIRSQNLQSYMHNVATVFDENYNLAWTQEKKNKDIAEGGSKGTILLSYDHQDKATSAFRKYIDALLDLLLPNNAILDYYKKEELLFLGPDEGTAGYMDWASQRAKERGYQFWKAFTTGKSLDRGGIPHDLFGMTTRSIHQYVVGTLNKLGIDESTVTKFQTGGPDGDLGSNEIKISKDKTIGIVDGSGVLYDPEGIDRAALTELAKQRKMAREFDKTKLSAKGFFVDVDQTDIKLPDGTVLVSGLDFRNNFHLNPLASSYLFVPCGGRPESISSNNVSQIIDNDKPRWKVIVEGANLFFTQEARLLLEKKGVVIFKDSSANKGGVTSSSLEVLSALSLSDEEFEKNMTVKGGVQPQFYTDYVKEVHRIIEENARLEFNCIWSENEKTGTPRSILSDTVSAKINELSAALSHSELWDNHKLRAKVLTAACPKNLLDLLGLDTILKRIPENYARAIFGTYLASRYVYKCGISANPEFSFFNFISQELKEDSSS
mmetsp:Transcript_5048/g.7107  ORF Transcript_5048/g.7107 Transcript_5048/m.7107 type:complete len:1008 (-) Transcript_5048:48-3071(-)